MSDYVDASLIVRAFTDEPGHEIAEAWFAARADGQLVVSHWCLTEVASALSLKARTDQLAPDQRRPLFDLIEATLRDAARMVRVERHHFVRATALLNLDTHSLRAGDALHLAIAQDVGATLWALDRRMAAAGVALGLDVRLLA